MLNKIRASLRLLFFAIGSFYYIFRYLIKASLLGHDRDRALRLRKKWFGNICFGLGVKIQTYGELPKEGGLLVSNHRSYFDPIIVLSQLLALPVGKFEVKTWPIIGWGAVVSGSIFVDRKTKEGRQQARKDIRETLQQGYCVMNFPEGTTHTNAQTIDFKPGAFRDAALELFNVYPVALEYGKKSDAWVGDDTFIRHFYECFGKKETLVKVSYGQAIKHDDLEKLLNESKAFIDSELIKIRKDWYEDNLVITDQL